VGQGSRVLVQRQPARTPRFWRCPRRRAPRLHPRPPAPRRRPSPPTRSQSDATWEAVVRTFVWADGSLPAVASPYLARAPAEFFVGRDAQAQQEHCIGFTFCPGQATLARIDKHPCDWEMSYLCAQPW
jgi:hypothetical protein